MKAESFVYTSTHKPLTMFGLPPLLLAITGAGFGITFAILVIVGFMALALPVATVVCTCLAISFYRRTRQDHHFVYTLTVPPKFWRGRKVRHLIAGGVPDVG
jgi:hypothetical protein